MNVAQFLSTPVHTSLQRWDSLAPFVPPLDPVGASCNNVRCTVRAHSLTRDAFWSRGLPTFARLMDKLDLCSFRFQLSFLSNRLLLSEAYVALTRQCVLVNLSNQFTQLDFQKNCSRHEARQFSQRKSSCEGLADCCLLSDSDGLISDFESKELVSRQSCRCLALFGLIPVDVCGSQGLRKVTKCSVFVNRALFFEGQIY